MKKLKRGLAALLVGEFTALRYKDKVFKKNIKKAVGPLDKIKIVFDGLFAFNKEIIEDLQKTNIEETKNKALNRFISETDMLEEKLAKRESEFEQRSEEKMPIYLMGLEKQFLKYEKKALTRSETIADDYDLASKVEIFKKRISKARTSLEKRQKT